MQQSSSRKRITVITPCYNEGERVKECHKAVKALFDVELPEYELEHLFADNFSDDQTPRILRDIAEADPNVSVVFNARNVGVLRSVYNALRHATGDAVIVMMAVDLQDPPEMIAAFVHQWAAGYDVVQGVRIKREGNWLQQKFRQSYYKVVHFLSQIDIPKDVGEFQLIDRRVVDFVLRIEDHDPYIRGLIAYAGFKTKQIPYTLRTSSRGFSTLRYLFLVDLAINGLLTFSKKPIRIMTLFGIILAMASLFHGFVNLIIILFFNQDAIGSGVPTIIVAIFFFIGFNFVFLGIIGEYVLSIHNQIRFGARVPEIEVLRRRGGADATAA